MDNINKHDYINIPGCEKRPGPAFYAENKNKSPAVTVITPFYNTGDVFHETARSLFNQSMQQFEWLIINDGSSDPESLKVLRKYRSLDNRINVIDHRCNKGLSAARNTGFRNAKSEFVFQLDSDDLIEPTTLEKCLWFLTSHPNCAFTKGYTIGFGAKKFVDWKKSFENTNEFLKENPITATAMIKKSVHQKVGGYDESWRGGFEDWEFWLKCASHGYWGATIPEHLDWYRTRENHSDRWMGFNNNGHDFLRNKLMANYKDLLQDRFPKINLFHEEALGVLNESIPFENRLKKDKKRLLIILPWFAIGGADQVNLDIVRLLTGSKKYIITICATHSGELEWLKRFERYTQDIFILPHFLRNRDYPRFLSYLIKSRKFDCAMITGTPIGYQILPYLYVKHPHLSLMNMEHIEWESIRQGNYARFTINLQSCLDLTVVSTGHLKEWMVNEGADPDKIEVCYTNIDTSIWKPSHEKRKKIRKSLGISNETSIIVFCGRLVEQKRPLVMAEVIRQLARENKDFVCLVVGDGPLRVSLEDFIKEHSLSCLRLLGWQTPGQLHDLFAGADIFFLPSEHEGISLSTLKALSMGLIVVCSDVGGQAELITSDCGILIKMGSNEIKQYVQSLGKFIKKSELRKKMGTAARDRVCNHFKIEDMGKKMSFLIERAIESHTDEPRSEIESDLARAYCIEMIDKNRLASEVHQYMHKYQSLVSEQATIKNNLNIIKCYPLIDGRYSEENSISKEYLCWGSVSIAIEIDDGIGEGPLRIDPSNSLGVVYIEELSIRVIDLDEVIYSANNPQEFDGIIIGGTALRLTDPKYLLLFAYGEDPQIYLPTFDKKYNKVPVSINIKFRHDQNFERVKSIILKKRGWRNKIARFLKLTRYLL